MDKVPDEFVLKLLAYHPVYGRQLEAILGSSDHAGEPLVETLVRLGILTARGRRRLQRAVARPPSSILAEAVFRDSSRPRTILGARPMGGPDVLAMSESVFRDLDSPSSEGALDQEQAAQEHSTSQVSTSSQPNGDDTGDSPGHQEPGTRGGGAAFSPTGTMLDLDSVDAPDLEEWSHDAVSAAALLGDLLPGTSAPQDTAQFEIWEPSVGQVFGRWRVVKLIGRGATASVWGAEDGHLHVEVALKLLHPHYIGIAESFLTEACLLAHLNHQHIVRVFDCGRIGATVFVASEWIRGASIGQLLRRLGPIDPTPAVEITFFTALALGHALRRELVHRDIKPDNIFVNSDGAVKLGDFGLASTVAGVRTNVRSGGPVGSPGFMCPGWLRDGFEPDHRSDIYSLGITLYQMMTGALPYVGGDVIKTLTMHRDMPIPERPERIPRRTWQIVKRMIAKHPDDRYQDYRSLATDLRNELSMLGGSTVPQSLDMDYESEALRQLALEYMRQTRY